MENQKTYIIRRIDYRYNDEFLHFNTLGGVKDVFYTKEEAEKELIRLEREQLEHLDLSDIEQLSGCTDNFFKEKRKFKKFSKTELGVDLVRVHETGNIFCERNTFLPKGLTDEQIKSFRQITGIKFFELTEFNGTPKFLGLWKKQPFFEKEEFLNHNGSIFFYNSYIDALKALQNELPEAFARNQISGSLSEISETPTLLESFLRSCQDWRIKYDYENNQLLLHYVNEADALVLNELLKLKPLEIREIEIDVVKESVNWYYSS